MSHWAVLAGAPVEAGAGGVGGAGRPVGLSAPAAAPGRGRGRQRHQGRLPEPEGHRRLAEGNLAAAARLTVGVGTVVNAHLRDGHAHRGLQLESYD